MRTLEGHKINPANDTLTVAVLDEPGQGGACHAYAITGFDASTNPGNVHGPDPRLSYHQQLHILFQNGPINTVGVNGITHEVLLAILIDRMESFQAGPYANDYNAAALNHLRSAQGCLLDRTRERMSRGVEGTHQK